MAHKALDFHRVSCAHLAWCFTACGSGKLQLKLPLASAPATPLPHEVYQFSVTTDIQYSNQVMISVVKVALSAAASTTPLPPRH
eukprot:6470345-Amphidinium_carterae.1